LHLRGTDVGDRWQAPADAFAPVAGAQRRDLAEQTLATQRKAIEGDGDNAGFTRDVGHPVSHAIQAFSDGR
jgi:hypothetical protein